jgi:pyruvate/2-oxoglutarate dehydrogenase complex dihydrolipoamide acyltransferase (E2) component
LQVSTREPARILPFPIARLPLLDYVRAASGKHLVHGLVEVDVTRARRLIREYRSRTHEGLSLTAFLAACVGRAVARHPFVHAHRSWSGRLVVFDDVDIGLPVERTVDGEPAVTLHVIRAAHRKAPGEIHREIRAAKAAPPIPRRFYRLYAVLPGILRYGFWRLVLRRPALQKRILGTVGLTALGMYAAGGAWGLPLSGRSLQIIMGGISRRLVPTDGRLEPREYLSLTISVDHDVVDGAPAARFADTLRSLIERGDGLDV